MNRTEFSNNFIFYEQQAHLKFILTIPLVHFNRKKYITRKHVIPFVSFINNGNYADGFVLLNPVSD